MLNSIEILKMYPESFSANLYTVKHFRMIGLVNVSIKYDYGVERVTLAYFRSSGTNSGKIRGLWYPIIGIKTSTGRFTEFTKYLNFVLENTTKNGTADKGWIAKSLFFSRKHLTSTMVRGFSNGRYYESLLKIGETLRNLYETNKFKEMSSLDAHKLNSIVMSEKIYQGNNHTQRENFEKFVEGIFDEIYYM
ncbi:hypothetical protein [Clostridium hydrogenum]|uniref:hypothetical protein n=1 Tax=Clostridium hydrogenum TaxID=2855764 RepID=UPI002E37134F|nr:hypothetical protein [Clostridium hydrogenum]